MADIGTPSANDSSYRGDEKVDTTETTVGGHEKSWATRNGLNFTSFTPHEDHGTGSVELERNMKPRHLNMIAIGGRSVDWTRKQPEELLTQEIVSVRVSLLVVELPCKREALLLF